MPKYVIEREIPNAGKLSAQELQAISHRSMSCDLMCDSAVIRPNKKLRQLLRTDELKLALESNQ